MCVLMHVEVEYPLRLLLTLSVTIDLTRDTLRGVRYQLCF
jgi:hypothetical protein